MTDELKAVQYGCGPIGSRIVQVAVDRGMSFVGAIDIDPAKVGVDLGTVVGLDRELGVTVSDDADDALAREPDVVFHSTASSLDVVRPQLEAAMAAGADVVSTTEELSYPWRRNPETATAIDEAAKKHGRSCLGTGINPGFAMDTMAAVLSTPCQRVDSIRVERVQDAATRRKPLQEKIGAGVDLDTFKSDVASEAGHVGLPESVGLLADALGWDVATVTEEIEPAVAEETVRSDYFTVDPGEVLGIHQVAEGTLADGTAVIELDLSMYLGASNPADTVEIAGEPDLQVVVDGGMHGDVTTPAVILNVVPRVRDGPPGLLTMADIETPAYTGKPGGRDDAGS